MDNCLDIIRNQSYHFIHVNNNFKNSNSLLLSVPTVYVYEQKIGYQRNLRSFPKCLLPPERVSGPIGGDHRNRVLNFKSLGRHGAWTVRSDYSSVVFLLTAVFRDACSMQIPLLLIAKALRLITINTRIQINL